MGGRLEGRGAWGFCEICQRPLGRLTRQQGSKRFCSNDCRQAALRARSNKPCEMCGKPCRVAENRTCGHACSLAWRRANTPGAYSEDRIARIRALFAEGLTQAEIADRVGATKSAIVSFRRRYLPTVLPAKAPRPRPAPVPRTGKPGLICQPEGADRRLPGRYCSAHPEIRWHPLTWRCRAAMAA